MFHSTVYSVSFIMDKAFCHMEHDDTTRKDLFRVMETFSKVKDSDGKMVGPSFKTMKSEFVVSQETIRAKSMICMMKIKNQYDQPEGVLTERYMNRSQQTLVVKD